MKKSIFALAVATAVSVSSLAQAETVLYGSLRLSVDYVEDSEVNVMDTGSRWGLKGGEDLGGGTSVFYNVEFGFDAAEGEGHNSVFKTRLAHVGFTGESWGTVAIGRMDNPFHYVIIDHGIDFSNEVGFFGSGKATEFVFGSYSSRTGNAVAYTSPNWSGFSFNGAVIMDSDVSNGRDADAWTLNAKYKHEATGVYANAGYMANRVTDVWALSAGWDSDMFTIGADFLMGTKDVSATNELNSIGWDIGGSYKFNESMSSVWGRYGQADLDTDVANRTVSSNEVQTWAIGFQHKLTKRTRAWVEFSQDSIDVKQAGLPTVSGDKANRLNVGIRHDF